MGITDEKYVEYLVVDTSAFIQNVPLQNVGQNIITVPEVVNEITSKRQLRRLCVLPYDLVVKEAFPESVQAVTDFTKETGDYPSLSATDIKVMALTYQLEKEHVGVEHLHSKPTVQRSINLITKKTPDVHTDVTGFYKPRSKKETRTVSASSSVSETDNTNEEPQNDNNIKELEDKFQTLECEITNDADDKKVDDILVSVEEDSDSYESDNSEDESDDDDSWITPSNIHIAKKQVNSELMEEKAVKVACMTTDFAMQNVLKQMNLNVAALDGRMIKQLRTFILRCFTCFGTTSVMTKKFCPKCGNNTLKRVAVSLDENGKQQIHINARKPLTGRGKRFSMPTFKGGKHSSNPLVAEDQPMPEQRISKLARIKNDPMQDDYIAGFSPFVTRDVDSKSAQLCIRPGMEVKHWMRKNPNEVRRARKK